MLIWWATGLLPRNQQLRRAGKKYKHSPITWGEIKVPEIHNPCHLGHLLYPKMSFSLALYLFCFLPFLQVLEAACNKKAYKKIVITTSTRKKAWPPSRMSSDPSGPLFPQICLKSLVSLTLPVFPISATYSHWWIYPGSYHLELSLKLQFISLGPTSILPYSLFASYLIIRPPHYCQYTSSSIFLSIHIDYPYIWHRFLPYPNQTHKCITFTTLCYNCLPKLQTWISQMICYLLFFF